MSWFAVVTAGASALAVLLLPGLALAWTLRLRGVWIWGFAGPASVAVVVIASVVTPLLGIGWSPLSFGAVAGSLVLVALALRLTVLRRTAQHVRMPSSSRRGTLLVAGGAVVGGVLIALQLSLIVGAPENISQTFDNVFHLNAARYIVDTGNASPFHVGQMTGEAVWFYPAGWHGVVSLVAMTSGASIPLSSNAVLFVVAAVIWPASIVLLTHVLTGGRARVDAAAGLLSALLPAFPFLTADYGVLYPYLLAVAVLPPAVAATIAAFRLTRVRIDAPGPVIVVLLGSLPGLAFAHPGGFVAWLVAAVVTATVSYVVFLRDGAVRRSRWIASIAFVAFLIVAAMAVYVLRPAEEARGWLPVGSLAQAAGEVIFASPHYAATALAVAVLLWIGVVGAIRRRNRRDILAMSLLLVFAGLYVVAQALHLLYIRDLITGTWYNDAIRLAALLPMSIIPLASSAVPPTVAFIVRVLRSRRVMASVGIASAVVVVSAVQVHSAIVTIRVASETYDYSADSPLVSSDELLLLERLPSEVGPDEVIAGNPWTGASLAYAFSDRRVLMPHILMDSSTDDDLINNGLSDAAPGGEVCAALDRTGVDYVLDFGSLEVHGGDHPFPGLEDLSDSDAVRLVDREGDARLYEIVGCEE